ncbi:MAG TPA: oligogalacturonate lyase family protein [Chloroflexota bacterium]|jgi:oligogalacturonide lyase
MARGDRYPAEKRAFVDETTGAAIVQLTDAPTINHGPYFLNSAWADRGRRVIVTSYRDGRPNLYAVDETSGAIAQLTDTGDVGPWSACVGADDRQVFFAAGGQLRVVDVPSARVEVVFDVGDGTRLGNLDPSPDGREVVTCARAAPVNRILAIATDGSGARTVFETTELLAHAQYSPDGRSLLYASNLPRLWIVDRDGRNNRVLRRQSHREWITHESWLNDHEVMFSLWHQGLAAIGRDGEGERLIGAFSAWHPSARGDGRLIVADTTLPDVGLQLVDPATGQRRTLCLPKASSRGFQWAEPEPVWEGPVSEEAYGPQWSHPHPSFSPDGRRVMFTSDRTGHPQVYVAHVPEGLFGAGASSQA